LSVATTHFHLFVYGSLRSGAAAHELLDGCERVGEASVAGTLYDIDGRYPALMLYGDTPVHGEIWRCPPALLGRLDEYEGAIRGLFRRVGVRVAEYACWTYVAGPALARRLTPARRIASGVWLPRETVPAARRTVRPDPQETGGPAHD
jgi:gamma-glutamylcyclotransferase (GGCT)/AIG2-like uncharacterized protein YtfP